MSNYNRFLLLLIFPLSLISLIANGKDIQEVQIESIQSTQGAGITCSSTMDGSLVLEVMGEIGKRTISIIRKDKFLYLSDKDINYSTSIYDNSKNIFNVLEVSRNIYFLNGVPVRGTVGDIELKKSQDTYNFLKNGLLEAHEKNKCLNWVL